MAITAFTGPPGSGKSHALVKDVIIPAVLAGRCVRSNIDGLDADAVRAYCLERVENSAQLGKIAVFHGDEALKPGFWPDEEHPDSGTVVKGGDLVVFDEWALTFPRRGSWPQGCNVEAFLRWHRHLNGDDGTATDIAIGTQLATDVHQNVRGLIVKSYKFRKLTALGAQGQYTWQLFEGHLQPKGGHYRTGTGSYDKAVFPLYASSAAARQGKHVELRTNRKESIWSGWQSWSFIAGAPALLVVGVGGLWWSFHGKAADASSHVAVEARGPVSGAPRAISAAGAPSSAWHIIGAVANDSSVRVVLQDDHGAIRMVGPDGFNFTDGRPTSGTVDGQAVAAVETLPGPSSSFDSFMGAR